MSCTPNLAPCSILVHSLECSVAGQCACFFGHGDICAVFDGYFLDNAGPDRRIYLPEGLLAKDEIPEYLTGEVPGE
jgi:hypothetical protein